MDFQPMVCDNYHMPHRTYTPALILSQHIFCIWTDVTLPKSVLVRRPISKLALCVLIAVLVNIIWRTYQLPPFSEQVSRDNFC